MFTLYYYRSVSLSLSVLYNNTELTISHIILPLLYTVFFLIVITWRWQNLLIVYWSCCCWCCCFYYYENHDCDNFVSKLLYTWTYPAWHGLTEYLCNTPEKGAFLAFSVITPASTAPCLCTAVFTRFLIGFYGSFEYLPFCEDSFHPVSTH